MKTRKEIFFGGLRYCCALIIGGAVSLGTGCTVSITTKIIPHSMFRTNMVLQRDKPVPVWGTAQAGQTVAVSFAGNTVAGKVAHDGSWSVTLPPLTASSEPRDMMFEYQLEGAARTKTNLDYALTLHNVVVGEVWYCAGQSNMEMGILMVADRLEELRDVKYPQIRLYTVMKQSSPFPIDRLPSFWFECERENIIQGSWNGFSAVAFFFGKRIHKELGVPVGLIQAAYGGSAINPWIPPEELKATPSLETYYEEIVEADRQYAAAVSKDPKAKHPFADMFEPNQLKPATLYNGMIHPVAPYAVRGFLWYQGESNVGDRDYAEKQKALIAGWRRVFKQGDLPFYYVQIAPWSYGSSDSLPVMWEQQEACLSIPHTGMAVTVDVGMADNIHPLRKKEVGERLARIALAKDYGHPKLAYTGPVFKQMNIKGSRAVITFSGVGQGLVSGDGRSLTWFTIAGEDMVFHPAQARITTSDTVTVSSPLVKVPVAVRYAWSNTPHPNLYSKDGLPARPFRTDKD